MGAVKSRKLWERFTAKKPSLEARVETGWPSNWHFAGDVKVLWYVSDKWRKDGDSRVYYHHTKARCWMPGPAPREYSPSPRRMPKISIPSQCAALAVCLGWEFESPDGRQLWAECDPGEILCAVEQGKRTFLFVLDTADKISALFEGQGLKVRPEGIVG